MNVCGEIQFWFKSDKNFGHCARMPKYMHIADSDVCISTIQREHCVSGDSILTQQYDKRIIAANCAARIILYY